MAGAVNTPYLFELSGELKDMPRDEAFRTVLTESDGQCRVRREGPGYLVMSFPDDCLDPVAGRLALTHTIGRSLGSFDPADLSGAADIELPAGTFAIRHKRVGGMMPEVDSQQTIRRLGGLLSKKNQVDLHEPDHIVRMLMSDRIELFLEEKVFDYDLLKKRKVSERPFFSPISLHPKYARALINLTGVARGGTVLDPFCGTGGIAIEAADMGMKAMVSDFDPEMVAGCRENMEFYHLKLADYETADVGDIADRFGQVDAIACDPPYGRSTKTGGENIDHIYKRALDVFLRTLTDRGRAGVVLPHVFETDSMNLEHVYTQYVHGSLSRHYHIFAHRS